MSSPCSVYWFGENCWFQQRSDKFYTSWWVYHVFLLCSKVSKFTFWSISMTLLYILKSPQQKRLSSVYQSFFFAPKCPSSSFGASLWYCYHSWSHHSKTHAVLLMTTSMWCFPSISCLLPSTGVKRSPIILVGVMTDWKFESVEAFVSRVYVLLKLTRFANLTDGSINEPQHLSRGAPFVKLFH